MAAENIFAIEKQKNRIIQVAERNMSGYLIDFGFCVKPRG
jgi:hypothetical protein